ncbi:MAG: lipocalin-like domain-containing protein [Candidatus Competibacter sp.]|nr:lipocalin-like domain-containing protein [Candidatus Competibacter sp.]MDG4584411.1 lipocalin-like domain-containing protein [Candidatus Competibacter sp.]
MNRRLWQIGLPILFAALVLATTGYYHWPRTHLENSAIDGVSVDSALGDNDSAGYQRAYQPRPFIFPADHGPHPEFRNEWWYVTGNLTDAGGRQFGYQLTLFRIALAPITPVMDSAWRTNQVYMGHFALTDVADNRHRAFERFSRDAMGLAGAQAAPLRVWLEDWELASTGPEPFPLRVRAHQDDIAVDLMLDTAKPLILQGEQGLSQKSAEPGNASYYYSYTRLPTHGTVRLDGQTFAIHGASWLDREWSTSALGPEQSGWDWFALQLDDERDLMFYRLRRKDGGVDPFSKGVLVAADGSPRALRWNAVDLQPVGEWVSSKTGDRYPAGWRLRVPTENLDLTVTPKIADQEMRLTVRYWEGAVAVGGRAGDRAVTGQGYLEMTRDESAASTR